MRLGIISQGSHLHASILKETLMRASSTFAFGATAVLAASILASATPAHADPAYSSENVIQIFLKQKDALKGGKTRALCVGTAADCKKQEAAAGPPPVQFDLLANFEFNSDQLTQAARENLDQFAKAIKDPRLAGSKFEIDGHTDAVGPEEYNLGLSERRAEAVVSYLTSEGIDASLLVAKGFGKTKPRVANPYSPENRRVETHLSE
jgi:outer membrane protein OmpA-like peptidoglycan-associated protein